MAAQQMDSLDEVVKQLAKKATFERAVRSLTKLLEEQASDAAAFSPADREKALAAVNRTATLLKTRYTAPGFWAAGERLFWAAEPLAASDPSAAKQLKAHVAAAEDILGTAAESSGVSAAAVAPIRRPPPYQFEGQLSRPEPTPPPMLGALGVDETLLQRMVEAATLNSGGPVPSNLADLLALHEHGQQNGNNEGDAGEGEGAGNQDESSDNSATAAPGLTGAASLENMLVDMLGPTAIPGLEEAIEASLQQGVQPAGAPPASKKEIAKLPVIRVGEGAEDKASKDGEEAANSKCAVCQEVWTEGDVIREMPCNHRFHDDCLKPWLEQTNSCPICRFEMRTDDMHYENRKEREKEEEEDRKGAENAVREDTVYMYL